MVGTWLWMLYLSISWCVWHFDPGWKDVLRLMAKNGGSLPPFSNPLANEGRWCPKIDRAGSTTDFCHLSGYHIHAMANQLLVVQVWSCRARWKRTFRLHLEPSLWPEPWSLDFDGLCISRVLGVCGNPHPWLPGLKPEGFQSDQAGHGLVWTVLTTIPASNSFFIPGTTGIVREQAIQLQLELLEEWTAQTWGTMDTASLSRTAEPDFLFGTGAWWVGNSLNQSWKMMKTDVDRWSFLEEVSPVADALSQGQTWTQVFFSMLPRALQPDMFTAFYPCWPMLRFKSDAFQQQLKDLQDTCRQWIDVGDGPL